MSSFGEQTQKFIDFLQKSNVELSKKLEIVDLRESHQGRGIIALEDIDEDETLFTIPKTAVLNIKTCEVSQKLALSQEELNEKYSQWEILTMCIFHELVAVKESRWSDYFAVLPEKFDTLMFWSDKELEYLKPSLVVNRVGKKESHDMYELLCKEGLKDFGLLKYKASFTEEMFHKIASWIQCYSFDLEDEDELKTMVVLADILNADTHKCNANLTYSDDVLEMKAIKKIAKDEQVYNTYGDHPNSEILRRYGYVEMTGSKFDFGEVPLSLVFEETRCPIDIATEICDILQNDEEFEDQEIVQESYECFCDGFVSPEFYFLLQLLTSTGRIEKDKGFRKFRFSSMDSEGKKRFVKRLTKKILQLVNSERITDEAHHAYQRVLKRRIEEYEQDEVDVEEGTMDRRTMAAKVLECEKNSIVNCLDFFLKKFSFVDDDKLLRNLAKKDIKKSKK